MKFFKNILKKIKKNDNDIIINEETLDIFFGEMKSNYESDFIKYYFKKERKDLSKEDKHTMDCFGALGMSQWCIDNVDKNKN